MPPGTGAHGLSGVLLARLRRHPLPINARLRNCITLTYALPSPVLRRLLPPGLELDMFAGFGFVAVALVEARSLRPSGLPAACGQDFFLAGYRVFTRFRLPDGRTIRGLRILRSDADRWPMVLGGNLLTHYNYHLCDASMDATPDRIHVIVRTADGGGDLDVSVDRAKSVLPEGSPFPSIGEARRFAGPLPFTFDYERETHAIIAIRATRTNWRPAPVGVDVRQISFFDRPEFAGCTPILAAAFHVNDIDYRWERGVRYATAVPGQRRDRSGLCAPAAADGRRSRYRRGFARITRMLHAYAVAAHQVAAALRAVRLSDREKTQVPQAIRNCTCVFALSDNRDAGRRPAQRPSLLRSAPSASIRGRIVIRDHHDLWKV